jgi:hypothetical protein
MNNCIKKNIILLLILITSWVSCKKGVDNPANDADHTAITTLKIQFKQGTTVVGEFMFDDPDGVGGANPIRFDTIKLNKNQTYTATITLQNKSTGTVQDVTNIIKDAGTQHEFFYLPDNTLTTAGLSIEKLDKDRLGLPLGFDSRWITPNTVVQGITKITLRHIVLGKSNNTSPTAGHADIEINFATLVQ